MTVRSILHQLVHDLYLESDTEGINFPSESVTKGGLKSPLFLLPYIKDYIKNVIKNVYALFISFHNVCGKVCLICGKVSLIVVTNALTNALWKCV